MAGRRRKKSGGRSYAWRYRGRIVACVFVEVIIICALVIMIGWNKGVKDMKSAHKYFAFSSLICMAMAIYSGHKMISGKSRKKKEAAAEESAE